MCYKTHALLRKLLKFPFAGYLLRVTRMFSPLQSLEEEIIGHSHIYQHNRSLYVVCRSSYVDRGKNELELFLAQVLLFLQSIAQCVFLSLFGICTTEKFSPGRRSASIEKVEGHTLPTRHYTRLPKNLQSHPNSTDSEGCPSSTKPW